MGAALGWLLVGTIISSSLVQAGEPALRKVFDVPAGPATSTLKRFVSQSGVQLLYGVDEVSRAETNPVKGEYTTVEAVHRLLANTGLTAVETRNGAIAINRVPDPKGQRAAQATASDRPGK